MLRQWSEINRVQSKEEIDKTVHEICIVFRA